MKQVAMVLLLVVLAAPAAAQETRFISDELVLVLRASPSGEAPSRGTVASGARVELLGTGEAPGWANIRTADGREGWILARFLRSEPVARDRAARAEKELAATQAELQKLKQDHARLLDDFSRISGGQPVASSALIQETETLRAQLAAKEREVATLRERYDLQRGSQRTLLVGGGLVAGGFLLALLLRLLWPKRRWGEF